MCYNIPSFKEHSKTMAKNKTMTAYLSVRVTPSLQKKFMSMASKLSTPSDIHRELIQAFVEDRMSITRPVDKKCQLYEQK